ncbi:PREDICTED: uncharacterized mitochondrial protein AtMg00810-like [Brassica oleracea var. oleracea]|uniref:uncharacterized mitochondrial protein AtMg00810-like n=1 Tax=Brassica oleracea var. oleracea TaxID=109376 RepID=UPI0006A6FF4C|nr:PREDICTED: uncharacterized mitochondrial protein AtMg00810-like [Brassica oleracea var. oleracea]
MDTITEFKRRMSNKFEMSDLGKLTYYLGIEVCQHEQGITLNQERYAKKILSETKMDECNDVQIPMDQGLRLSKASNEKNIYEKEYRRNIGYMQQPMESHGAALKQILGYLKGSTSYGFMFNQGTEGDLRGFRDSSHAVDEDDGRSTAGHVFYLGDSPITWCSQKQETVALSACEAEFMAATKVAKQAIWLQDLYEEITDQTRERVVVLVDNKSALALTKNPHVPGDEQKTDILTKALGRIKYKEMRELIGVQDVSQVKLKFKGENVGDKLENNLIGKISNPS